MSFLIALILETIHLVKELALCFIASLGVVIGTWFIGWIGIWVYFLYSLLF